MKTTEKPITSPETQALIQLWQLSCHLNQDIDRSIGTIHGIGFNEFIVLDQLLKSSSRSLSRVELAKHVGLTASGVTRMLSPMEKIGLVRKQSNPRDARVSLVEITEVGEKIYHDACLTVNDKAQSHLRRFDASQLTSLQKLLSEIA